MLNFEEAQKTGSVFVWGAVHSERRKMKFSVNFSNLKGISQEPLDQYYAYLYSFECIFHAESKYGDDNLNIKILNGWTLSAVHTQREKETSLPY